MHQGSEAYLLDANEGALAREHTPSLEVFDGRGLDARARSGVSARHVAALKVFAAALAFVAVLAVCRVAIFSSAVGVLSENTTMRTELKQARATQDDLRIERSVLSSTSRIDRIATQSYGMVRADSSEKMVASSAAGSADAADSSSSDSSEGQDSADKAASDSQEAAAGSAAAADSSASAASGSKEAPTLDGVALTEGDGSTAGSNAADVD